MDTQYKTGLFLLTSFIKNWKSPQGDFNWKLIKCRLWFNALDEMQTFVKTYQEDPSFMPEYFDKENSERWTDYYTCKMNFEK